MRRILGIVGLALVGLAVAVGVTMTTSSLSSQTIGISGEPITAGQELAVPERSPAPPPPRATDTQPRTVETPDDRSSDDRDSGRRGGGDDRSGKGDDGGDDSGRGRGRGRGRGGDDSGHGDDD